MFSIDCFSSTFRRRLGAGHSSKITLLTGLALLTLASGAAIAGTLTVGSGQAYPTIQSAFDVANPGDTILIKNGIYTESPSLSRSGTSSSRITIRSEGGNAHAVVKGRIVLNAEWVRIEGLRLDGLNGTVYNSAPGLEIQKANNQVVSLHIQNYAAWGISFPAITSGTNYAAYNYIYNCGGGIFMTNGATAEFNTLQRMNRNGSTHGGNAPADYFQGFGSNMVIRNNLAFGTIKAEVGDQDPDFVQSWNNGNRQNVLIENNVAVGPYLSQGVMINYHDENSEFSVSNWTIRNNVFTNWTGSGIDVQRGQNFSIENNTLVGHPKTEAGHHGVRFSGAGGSGVVRNNMLIDCEEKGAVAENSATMDKAYNFYFGGVMPTAGTGDKVNLNPQFMDKANANFRLWNTSPAINGGQTRSFSHDLEGKSRPSGGFDMGAYEATTATLLHPAELLVVQGSSGEAISVVNHSSANGGLYRQLAANGANDYLTLRVAVPTPGSYNLKVRTFRAPDLGIYRVAIAEEGESFVNVGGTFDTYNSSYSFSEYDLGTIVVKNPTSLSVRLTCTGKNASSGGYKLSCDSIKLTSVTPSAGEVISDNRALLNPFSQPDTSPWISSTATSGYYGADYLHDNNDSKGSKTFTFLPGLAESGNYTVYARHTASSGRANNVPFEIVTNTGTTNVTVNQRINGGTWISLGTYNLNRDTAAVTIRTTGTNGHVIADAVRFVPAAGTVAKLSAAEREALTFGVTNYIPGRTNTGLLPGWSYANLTPVTGTNGVFSAAANTTYQNKIFWCQVDMPRSGSVGPTFINCVFASRDPETIGTYTKDGQTYAYGADSSGIKAHDIDHPQWTVKHSVFDPKAWFDPSANPPGGARTGDADFKLRSSAATRAGRGSILWCEIKNCQDGLGIFHQATNIADSGFTHLKGNWIHDLVYYQGAGHWQPEGTHSDGIQFHKGLNVVVEGNYIEVGHNAGIQLQLEQSSALLRNVTITNNLFVGASGTSGYGLNHGLKQANDFTGGSINNNHFIQRADGKYIIARQQYYWSYSNNRRVTWNVIGESFTDIGAVNISNGGP